MTMIQVRKIKKHFGDKQILDQLSFEINEHDKIGLVGINGAGKTTLANIIHGDIVPDEGTITRRDELKVGYLLQSVDYFVNDYKTITSDFLEIASELGLNKVHSWKEERFLQLSGGEKLKIALAQIWSAPPDILILDEPTNHLDLHGVNWLVNQLKEFKGSVIIISHDRYFLDKTVTKIFELEQGKLVIYNGNYSEYRDEKKKRYEEQSHQYQVQQKYKEQVEGQISQLKQWAGKAHHTMREQEGMKEYHGVKAKKRDKAIKSKLKRLHQELEKNKLEKPIEEKKVRFQFEANQKRGKRAVEANNITKMFSDRILFKNSHFYINSGERIGIIGPNGSGKTTLLNILLGNESLTQGEISMSSGQKTAYLSQDVADMPIAQTAIEALHLSEQEKLFQARTTLANMGMNAAKLNQPIGTLSLGERTRIKLTNMLINEYDLLILDEPTNHLDLASREQLEETLSKFAGTIIIVSHDYYFMNKLCDKLLVIDQSEIKRFEMNLEQYELKKVQQSKPKRHEVEEELLRVNTEISAVLGELSFLTTHSEKYMELDARFNLLAKRKQELLKQQKKN
ncbi:ribosomal protection-like ABC-F family protein [Metabacillus sediminilitoris]|uniref:ABC-F type ribosomal protection protein n=1 Tax=Metabacillus sediminilitoris TaxID=2567941 RepID=A0A4V3WES0_9BACI|nr:ABC-F type ribosomal protection protein [Metabacillus sediminilitoris]QGQ46395.1 ABC-F type ribosomal protection protein [Metabacillus sediminilitoris]THF77382.1 ABC-F type ribosomal protection protein [Metabacillus sediminilitoris]